MKRALLTILIISYINSVKAQFTENNAIYTTGEVNIGNYIGIDMNMNYVYQENYSFKIGYSGHIRKPKSQPIDYSSGLVGVFLLQIPYDQIENYKIAVGKVYKLNYKGTIRANLSLGVGYTIIREPKNWEKIDGGFLSENYTWEYGHDNTVSLILNPKLNFLLPEFMD